MRKEDIPNDPNISALITSLKNYISSSSSDEWESKLEEQALPVKKVLSRQKTMRLSTYESVLGKMKLRPLLIPKNEIMTKEDDFSSATQTFEMIKDHIFIHMVKNYMNHLGITYSDLSKKSGFDKSKISKIMNFISDPNVDTFEKILDALDLTVMFIPAEEGDARFGTEINFYTD